MCVIEVIPKKILRNVTTLIIVKKNIKLNSDEWKNKKTIQNPKKHDAATLKVCLKNNEVVREVLVFKKPTNNNLGDFKCYHLKRISTLYNFT